MPNLTEILTGPTADRPNRAAHDMTEAEAEARHYLLSIERHMPKSRRGATIRKLADAPVSRLSPEARALYRRYAEAHNAGTPNPRKSQTK